METLGQNSKEGVKLGLQKEVDWLPQNYTERSRRCLRLVLVLLAAAATLPPTRKVLRWCTSPPVATLADALQLGVTSFLCELANWLYVGFGLLRSLIRGGQNLLASGTGAATEVGVNVSVEVGGVSLIGGGVEKAAQKKKQ